MAIVEVVKYNGTPDVFAWKYPSEELGTWTQLIVNESQEAILFKGGKALDVFQSGRHTLDTANIPILNKIINLPFGGRSPFTAEVWYINKLYSLDIKWGTPSPIEIQDPKYGVFIPVRSNGMFGIQIEDSKKFIVKLVGTLPVFDKTNIVKYFRGLYITKIKDSISSYLVHKKISVLEINAYIDELSSLMKEKIEPTLEEYGIKLLNFYVNDISIPEEDSAVKKLKDALAKRAEMNIIGYDYKQERSFDTLEGAAKNSSSSSAPIMGAGMGIGMGVGLGGAVGGAFGSMSGEIKTEKQKECSKCHAHMDENQRFCGECGYDNKKNEADNKEVSKIICKNCGCEVASKAKFCPECGQSLVNRCPKCNTIIEGKAKFCPECGYSLVNKCPKCNAVIEGKPKFCPECGQSLN